MPDLAALTPPVQAAATPEIKPKTPARTRGKAKPVGDKPDKPVRKRRTDAASSKTASPSQPPAAKVKTEPGTSKTGDPKTEATSPWIPITGDEFVGLPDSKKDVYRIRLTAVTNRGNQYKGIALASGKSITFMKAAAVPDPGVNKVIHGAKTQTDTASTGATAAQKPPTPPAGRTHRGQKPVAPQQKPATTSSKLAGYTIPKAKKTPAAAVSQPAKPRAQPALRISPATNPLALAGLPGGVAQMDPNQQLIYAAIAAGLTETEPATPESQPDDNTGDGDDPEGADSEPDEVLEEDEDGTSTATGTSSDNVSIVTAMPGDPHNNITIPSALLQQLLLNTNQQQPQNQNIFLAGLLAQNQQVYQQSLGDHRAQMEEVIRLGKLAAEEETDTGKQKNIDVHETEIDSIIDDMQTQLSIARYLPMPTDLRASQAMVPVKIKPQRTNYNLEEYGITMNKFQALAAIHDRKNSGIQLKAYRHENLARIDAKNQVQLAGKDLQIKDEDRELGTKWQALLSIMNFHILSVQTCPANNESLVLLSAVFNYTLGGFPDPSSTDISQLFVRWILLRASRAGKPECITYKETFDMLRDIVQTRMAKVANLVHQNQTAQQQLATHTKENIPPGKRFNNNTGNRTHGGRKRLNGGGGGGGSNAKRPAASNAGRAKRPRGPNLCRNYNSPQGCSRAPNATQCMVQSGPLIHACDYRMGNGLFCGQNHPRHANH